MNESGELLRKLGEVMGAACPVCEAVARILNVLVREFGAAFVRGELEKAVELAAVEKALDRLEDAKFPKAKSP